MTKDMCSQRREDIERDLSNFLKKLGMRCFSNVINSEAHSAQPNLAKPKNQEDIHAKNAGWPRLTSKMKI